MTRRTSRGDVLLENESRTVPRIDGMLATPLNHADYPPDSFEAALLDRGVEGVRAAILKRMGGRKAPHWAGCGIAMRDVLTADNNDKRLIEIAWSEGWRGVAKWYSFSRQPDDRVVSLARRHTLHMLGYLPALCLMFGLSAEGARNELRGTARELHGRMSLERRSRERNRGIRIPLNPALATYLVEMKTALDSGQHPADAPVHVQRAIDSFRLASPDLRTDLPPAFDVLCDLMEFALSDPATAPSALREIEGWRAFLNDPCLPAPKALKHIWQTEFTAETRGALARARYHLHRRHPDGARYVSPDPIYNVLAAQAAASVGEKPTDRTIALGRWLVRVSGQPWKRPQGIPMGPGHEFVQAAFLLYGIRVEGIYSGAYLKNMPQ